MMGDFQKRLLRAIPGGAHTYSRGYDQYPENAPEILSGGRGAYVFDAEKKSYLDYGMALRAVNIGYAENEIDEAAINQIRLGNNLTRPSLVELQAAELLVDLIDSVDMVKFTKNGSSSVSAAVKLARAYTGRELIVCCADHPFFSYDDWFISSTPIKSGIPANTEHLIKLFRYNDISSLKKLIDQYPGKFACLVMEAETNVAPLDGFLHEVQKTCRENGIVFILDEMITGFRWHLKGAQYLYGLEPDLSTFGKAMANGYSVSCVAGRREIMELGSIEFDGRERLFLLSSTHGAEMAGLGAFIATIQMMQRERVVAHLWEFGESLKTLILKKAIEHGVSGSLKIGGAACSPFYSTLDESGNNSLPLRTLFLQEMIKGGVLMPWIALCMRHGEKELLKTSEALDQALPVYKKALEGRVEDYLKGPVIKPVFRKFN
jgi:glutamate-1-semialdehyde 2,1-aminomutase